MKRVTVYKRVSHSQTTTAMVSFLLSTLLYKWGHLNGSNSHNRIDDGNAVLFGVLTLTILFVGAFIYYRIAKAIEGKRVGLGGNKPLALKEPLPMTHKAILAEKSDYYNRLKPADKELFEKRVRYYMTSKMFTSEDGYSISEEMKVMVSASACQISFGLPVMANTNYSHIVIMPNGSMTSRTASKNSIVIPWREFVEGYSTNDDGQNEGLKVMAMALIKDNRVQDKQFKFFNEKKFAQWEKISAQEAKNFMAGMFESMDTDERIHEEYFAMAVVYFFELPVAFRTKYPALYTAISELLRQDTVKGMVLA